MARKFQLSYDDYEVTQHIIKDIIDNYEEYGYSEKPTEDEVYSNIDWEAYQENYQFAWENFLYVLGEEFKKRYKILCAKVEGWNLNWRGSSGYKYINADESNCQKIGESIIRQIAPKCDFSINVALNKSRLFITIFHHDCPTGSQFLLKPCAYSTYEREAY